MNLWLKLIGVICRLAAFLVIGIVLLGTGSAFAQSAPSAPQAADQEPAAVLELGAVTSWDVKGGAASFGPNFAVEFTPIEHWLEIEAGVTPLFKAHSTEWDADLLFKKPWTLSRKAEFMFGIGPEWVHTNAYSVRTDSVAGEVVGDFMFWPGRKHKFGWYLEPGYDYAFARGHEHSIGISGGLLIGIP
jgi:hypothetical protein